MIFQNTFCPIYDLLQGNNLFIVPTFQRPFRWEERHISILVSDIAEACHAARSHYLSPMHLIKINPAIPEHLELLNMYSDNHYRPNIGPGAGALVDDNGFIVSVYLVVDGQQRLISTLAVFSAFHVPLASSITIGGQVYPKLIAGSQAEDTQVRIGLNLPNNLPNPAAPQNIAAAIRIQQAFATANDRAAAIGNMPALIAFLQVNLKTLGVCLDPEFALGSFLTLNDRGKKLTILEKLKAHCMYLDLLRFPRDPFHVNHAFGTLYRSLEQTDSLLTDDTAVQIATLFRVQGIVTYQGKLLIGAPIPASKMCSLIKRAPAD